MSTKTKFAKLLSYIVICVILTTGCQGRSQEDEWLNFGKAVLEASKTGDIDKLVKISFTDIQEIRQISDDLGIPFPSGEELERVQEKLDRATRDDIQVFLRSYEDLFDGQLAIVVTTPIDLKGAVFETESGTKDAEAILGRLDPHRAIVWVKEGETFHGILIDEVYRTESGLKVNYFCADDTPWVSGGTLQKKRAILECLDIENCTFPSQIEYERVYLQ